MHLLAVQTGAISAEGEAIDFNQSPGDVVFLTLADSDLALLSRAYRQWSGRAEISLRAANISQLQHPLSVDLYCEKTLAQAKLIVVRLLGGVGYWRYGVEQLANLAEQRSIPLVMFPGDDQPDAELMSQSTIPIHLVHQIWRYFAEGGMENAVRCLDFFAELIRDPGSQPHALPALPLPRCGLWRKAGQGRPILLVFYRALVQAAQTQAIDTLIEQGAASNLAMTAVYVTSLKDSASALLLEQMIGAEAPDVILNATAFAIGKGDGGEHVHVLDRADCPVLQLVLSSGSYENWQEQNQGLSAKDLAMQVVLPEVDGRVLAGVISFKAQEQFDPALEVAIIAPKAVPDRVAAVINLAQSFVQLRHRPERSKKIGILLANYPNKDGRLANGVGLDTPASTIEILRALNGADYDLGEEFPQQSQELMEILQRGPSNDLTRKRIGGVSWPVAHYLRFFKDLPEEVQQKIHRRWGAPQDDPFVRDQEFILPIHQFGHVAIAIQPARGYNIDPSRSYHDPDLPPPHGYLAVYFWLRHQFGVDAIIHVGKHGNLEWLPGKSLILSAQCFPEVLLGPVPHFYPFIVNDPGEGTQAKRRTHATIIDHLTPPLTQSETFGAIKELEVKVDEYYQAAGLDPRRLKLLGKEILNTSRHLGLDKDIGLEAGEAEDTSLNKIDAYLCELKDLQIRDGLHVFSQVPPDPSLAPLLLALVRLPRGRGEGKDQSILRALAKDLALDQGGFDPLIPDFTKDWDKPKPPALDNLLTCPWRHQGDCVERLELLALSLIRGEISVPPNWFNTEKVLGEVNQVIRPLIIRSAANEIDNLLKGLAGRFVPPGSSGAPTRGRLDVLPTGRNFYAVDTRAVPTQTAWELGWKSAQRLVETHFQNHGEYPKKLAISVWGTSNMRTGGDDIAQILALMGVKPRWEMSSGRITGYEILPLAQLARPRVDVMVRISGFFRDAFPFQIELLDAAIQAVAALDEQTNDNPLAAEVQRSSEDFRQSTIRIFGSKPGAYGAGLQALIDERGWQNDADLAAAYMAWGSYAYGQNLDGVAANQAFRQVLKDREIIVQNQDNREHDILDSDDYYQFEGGLAVAIRHLSGQNPTIYHNDHSKPFDPKIRTLKQEIGRIVRGRAANPKWIKGVMRHGYKGAFEIAATLDYLFAFAATTQLVDDHHFDQLFESYFLSDEVRDFIEQSNPQALKEMATRFDEALARGMWHPASNRVGSLIAQILGTEDGQTNQ